MVSSVDRPAAPAVVQALRTALFETLESDTVARQAASTIVAETDWPMVIVALVDGHGGLLPAVGAGAAPSAWLASVVAAAEPVVKAADSLCYGFRLERDGLLLGVLAITFPDTAAVAITPARALAEVLSGALNNARQVSHLRRRLGQMEALQEATSVFAQHLELPTILWKIAEQLAHVVNATSVYICGYDAASQTMKVLAEFLGDRAGEKERVSDLGMRYYLPDAFPRDIQFLADGEPEITHIDDPELSDHELAHFQQYGGKTSLTIPLRWQQKTIAYAELWESEYRREFSADEIALCRAIAGQAVVAMENARLFGELQQRLAEQTVLRESIASISSTLDLKGVLNRIAQQMGQLVGATSVHICAYNQDKATARVLTDYVGPVAAARSHMTEVGLTYYLPRDFPGATAFLDAGRTKTAHVDDPDLSPVEKRHLDAHGVTSTLRMPLRFRDRTIAYAELWSDDSRSTFSREEIDLCRSVALHAAIAMENARLFQTINVERSRLRALIEAERDGIILVGIDQTILVVNELALSLLRLAGGPAAWVDRPFQAALDALRAVPDLIGRRTFTALERDWLSPLPTAGEGARGEPREGELELPPHAIHWFYLPVRTDDAPVGQLLVLRDVSEARQLTRLREDLTHSMIHDLRGPLTAISMSLELLAHYENDPDQVEARQRAAERARGGTKRLLKLVNNMLDITKLENNRLRLNHQLVFLEDLIKMVLAVQAPQAELKQIKLNTKLPANLPLLRVDGSLIERVLQNLIENGIKYTPARGKVTIGATVQSQNVLVRIRDTGPGLKPGTDAFAKFVSGQKPGRGSGLGLYFCRLAVVAHGQKIWVESELGRGATFYFTLPIA